MRTTVIASCLAGTLLFTLPLLAADDTQPPLDRLKAAADLTALDGSNLRPWHWKLDISVFDNFGTNPQPASLEMWSSNGNLRSVLTLGTRQITTLRIGDNLYRTAGDEKDFAAIRLIEMQALRPISAETVQPSTKVNLVPETVAAIKLDCMVPMVGQSGDALQGMQSVSFCFEQDTGKMVLTHEPGDFSILRPRVGMFQAHQVPVELQTFSKTVMMSDAKTTKLATEPVDPSMFKIDPGMGPVNAPIAVQATDLRGLVLSRIPPVPPDPKRHLGGAVTFDATIGKDGHIVSLQPTPKSVAGLIPSAKDAVSHWIFRPYLISGVPVEVTTQFTVTYSGGPGFGGPHGPSDDQDAPKGRGR